jgi:hypothetical protein
MLIKDLSGIKHFVAKEYPFGVDTICGIKYVTDEFENVSGYYTDCTCEKCFSEIESDLKRPAKKKVKNIIEFRI